MLNERNIKGKRIEIRNVALQFTELNFTAHSIKPCDRHQFWHQHNNS